MIAACPHAGAIPMVREPDAQEWHIQHTTDIGCLGVIIATVDDVDRAREAAKWARYPPVARRSTGAGQAASIWGINGINYHNTVNDNMLVTIMIETPTGVANAFDIASVPGVDVVIIGNADLASFSGFSQDDPRYWELVKKVHDDVIRAGKIFGQASAQYAGARTATMGGFFRTDLRTTAGCLPTPDAAVVVAVAPTIQMRLLPEKKQTRHREDNRSQF